MILDKPLKAKRCEVYVLQGMFPKRGVLERYLVKVKVGSSNLSPRANTYC